MVEQSFQIWWNITDTAFPCLEIDKMKSKTPSILLIFSPLIWRHSSDLTKTLFLSHVYKFWVKIFFHSFSVISALFFCNMNFHWWNFIGVSFFKYPIIKFKWCTATIWPIIALTRCSHVCGEREMSPRAYWRCRLSIQDFFSLTLYCQMFQLTVTLISSSYLSLALCIQYFLWCIKI